MIKLTYVHFRFCMLFSQADRVSLGKDFNPEPDPSPMKLARIRPEPDPFFLNSSLNPILTRIVRD